jgi:hypothetical protein
LKLIDFGFWSALSLLTIQPIVDPRTATATRIHTVAVGKPARDPRWLMSADGPFATCRDVRSMSAIRGEPDSFVLTLNLAALDPKPT